MKSAHLSTSQRRALNFTDSSRLSWENQLKFFDSLVDDDFFSVSVGVWVVDDDNDELETLSMIRRLRCEIALIATMHQSTQTTFGLSEHLKINTTHIQRAQKWTWNGKTRRFRTHNWKSSSNRLAFYLFFCFSITSTTSMWTHHRNASRAQTANYQAIKNYDLPSPCAAVEFESAHLVGCGKNV